MHEPDGQQDLAPGRRRSLSTAPARFKLQMKRQDPKYSVTACERPVRSEGVTGGLSGLVNDLSSYQYFAPAYRRSRNPAPAQFKQEKRQQDPKQSETFCERAAHSEGETGGVRGLGNDMSN